MPAETVRTGLPYPIGTDPINVAEDMRLLAEATLIGSQGAGTTYLRTDDTFRIFKGGDHSEIEGDAGGGQEQFHISAAGSVFCGGGRQTVTPLNLIGQEGHAYIPFHVEASGYPARSGFIGYPGEGGPPVGPTAHLWVSNERVNGDLMLDCERDIVFRPASQSLVVISSAVSGTVNVGGHTATTDGTIIRGDGAISSNLNSGTISSNSLNLMRGGTPAGVGGQFVRFARDASATFPAPVQIGTITVATGGSGVLYNTTSDRRLKADRGPIQGAVERLKQLIPRRIVWNGDETQTEMDGFFADEVTAAVPEAVTGEPDATLEDGGIDPQQLNLPGLVPLLVAALKEAIGRIEVLEARGV